ncbi:hypothetical protein GPALN_005976 [Globodera pallida]|nr:hypothetical protein GPALN_005976 [Globodera pallida]
MAVDETGGRRKRSVAESGGRRDRWRSQAGARESVLFTLTGRRQKCSVAGGDTGSRWCSKHRQLLNRRRRAGCRLHKWIQFPGRCTKKSVATLPR